ncbi:hypothetical protein [Streptomyces sp. PSKA30]|uniref:hypothetical protein n=1 Tax=Streptomyces sp. PSKA30 TaxID=2874597 RepID=UPI001CD122BD|nr:hypothetical protein [Streptomyces sp. PSKA30]MBZ9643948.1 hypothetical protein [Streptomyces sp. PSKA30]
MDASSPTNIWAVGSAEDASGTINPLVRHWDGTRWSEVPFGGTDGREVRLHDVEALGPKDVWAAGTYIDRSRTASLPNEVRAHTANRLPEQAAGAGAGDPVVLRHWNGDGWTETERPAPAEGWTRFVMDLTALGLDSVWLSTLDRNESTGQYAGQLERWDGMTWRTEKLPAAPGGGTVEPQSVTGTGPDDVWVSVLNDKGGVLTPLLYHFDGHGWTVKNVPVPFTHEAGWTLSGAATTPNGDLHVIVETNAAERVLTRSAARWDGQTWRQLPAPDYEFMNDLIADNSGTVWAAGWLVGELHPVFSRWNGASWVQEAPPTELTSTSWGSTVADMSAVPGTHAVVAVGAAACESVNGNCGMIASRGMR